MYASGFTAPVAFVQDPTDRDVQFVVEQGGRIRVVRGGSLLPADFLDLRGQISSGGERGLLGLAFAPDYGSTRRVLRQLHQSSGPHRRRALPAFGANPLTADPASRFDLRFAGEPGAFVAQPFANHNGGNLAFGPDGFLYIGLGDGGSGNDPDHRAQNPSSLLGKMLRIDVNLPESHPVGYLVPPAIRSSPAPMGARPEIWSFGLRNPWRYSFDDPSRGGTGALVLADVGQNAWEEVDYEPRRPRRPELRLAQPRGRARQRRVAAARLPAADRSDPRVRHTIGAVDHRRLRLSRRRAGLRVARPVLLRGLRDEPRLVDRAVDRDPTGEATASDLREHTADLGGVAQLTNVSASASTRILS